MIPLFRRFYVALLALLIAWGGIDSAQGEARVESISFDARGDGQGYVVRVGLTEHVKAYSMPDVKDGQRVTWTLFNTALDAGFERPAPTGPITTYEITESEGHLTLRFALAGERAVQATAYRDRASDDVLLAITYDAPTAPAPPVSAQERASGTSATRSGSGRSGSAAPSSAAASSTSGERARWRFDTVVIDPGHGGKDPGTQGHGLDEKDIVLDVAKILGGYLEEKLGIDVVYTRTDDRFVELHERGRIANEAEGKLFISLHANAIEGVTARGTETYFLGQHKTEAARRVMERENRVVNLENDSGQYEALDEEKLVRYALMQSANMRQSEYLAALIEEQFDERVHRKSRGVKQAGFQVLWEASMPAVLVELGFLTHSSEARFLASENGKVYLASAIFRAVRDYKKEYEKGMNIARKE
ncbi:MAG: N-acetylmuramoyl-L-alanine amidase [Bacteroidetes bacterium]|jgi:N-acetylmuramoyl-L-alanine amidase|nr:N-acetylmuramoyl-L-alanine amidase [Bacteroidota bacterium]